MKILFVCTGNTCRSAMAEAMWRRMGGDAFSAGLRAAPMAPASWNTVDVMAEQGIDVTGHRAQRLSPEVIGRADLIVPLTEAHGSIIAARYPEAKDRILLMGDIPDPYGGDLDDYRQCAMRIRRMLDELKERLG